MMNDIELFPHNEEAYKKLINCLQDNQMVALNHATGTGKSFILLKYLFNNKDKNILFMSPTYQIIDQLLENHANDLNIADNLSNLDTMIYSNILKGDINDIASKYDVIMLDEYHRCGSKIVGKKVQELLDILKNEYPDTKVIGTTATEIRYLDNEKNMNNILFDGVCASTLTLSDAILNGILPVPKYISSSYALINDLSKIENNIEKYCYSESLYSKAKELLDKYKEYVCKIFEEEQELEEFKKVDNGKYLMFSSQINKISDDEEKIKEYFGTDKIRFFQVHSLKSKEENKKILEEFRNAKDGINVLSSINVLNEGLHVKDIDGIFMLRKTSSPIIYFQQIGRLLSFSTKKRDLKIIDLVGNLENHKAIHNLYKEIIDKALEYKEKYPDKSDFYNDLLSKLEIVDYSNKVKEISNEIKDTFNKKNLIRMRIYYGLENYKDNDLIKQQTIIDIYKYLKYIDKSLFDKIKESKIDNSLLYDMDYLDFDLLSDEEKYATVKVRDKSDFEKFNNSSMRKEYIGIINENNEEEITKKVFDEVYTFMFENNVIPKLNRYSGNSSYDDIKLENDIFYKSVIFNNLFIKYNLKDNLDKLRDEIILNNRNSIINDVILFIRKNNGNLPSLKIDDKEEKELFKRYLNIQDSLTEEEIKFIEDEVNKVEHGNDLCDRYIDFIRQYKRFPLIASDNEEEVKLEKEYERNKSSMNNDEKIKIKKLIRRMNETLLNSNTAKEAIRLNINKKRTNI